MYSPNVNTRILQFNCKIGYYYLPKKKLIAIRLVHNNVTVIDPHDSQFCVCTLYKGDKLIKFQYLIN